MSSQSNIIFLSFLLLLTWLPVTWAEQSSDAEANTEPPSGITDYIAMEPTFVTHVGKPDGKLAYLKAAVSLRASQKTTREAVQTHMPRLRHELVMLFGEQTDTDTMTTMKGQQALREEAKSRLNKVLDEQQTGEVITGVLFTEFVVQK